MQQLELSVKSKNLRPRDYDKNELERRPRRDFPVKAKIAASCRLLHSVTIQSLTDHRANTSGVRACDVIDWFQLSISRTENRFKTYLKLCARAPPNGEGKAAAVNTKLTAEQSAAVDLSRVAPV